MKYTFIKEPNPDNSYDISKVTVDFSSEYLPEILKEFVTFLDACGYSTKKLKEKLDIE